MTRLRMAAGLAVAFLICGGAQAQPVSEAATPEVPAAAQPAEAGLEGPKPLALEEMNELSGGQGVNVQVLSSQQLTATSSGNTINAGTLNTGAVSFAPGALGGFNGVGNFVINTGANNTLQGAINLSIVTAPGP